MWKVSLQNWLPIILLCIFVVFSGSGVSDTAKVQMRIVRDTANYGYFGNNLGDADVQSKLTASENPAEFSGPILLKKLLGRCYDVTLERYRYVFCPFQNMTQHETATRWNSYQGVIGVWSHWNIKNNTFGSMVFTHGDDCGDADRSVEVYLQCGTKDLLLNVTEPVKCHYEAVFQTRFVCHSDSLLVYPRLSSKRQHEWDHLWTDYKRGHLTEKGYNKDLQNMFYEIGFAKPTKRLKSKEKTASESSTAESKFTDLGICNLEYEKVKKEVVQLNEEIEALKLMLDIHRIRNRTIKYPPRS